MYNKVGNNTTFFPGQIYLSIIPTTKIYINLNIPEVNDLMER